ncbi:MAG: hypothetical protein O7A66_03090 [Alphaproteobacteria bacterium]|nr:hypothetical protein [Alphaproteobacteria bacterium]
MTAISMRWRTLRPLFALTLVPYAIPAMAAGTDDPDWPCVQRLMPELSAGAVWAGPSIENAVKLWREKPAVQSLVARIAARRTPVEEGVGAIEAFAKTLGVGKDATLTLVFAGLFATIDAERSLIIAGIKRYAKRQRRLADRIRDLGAGLKGIPRGEPDERDARRAELYRQWTWATRIFDERERSSKALCDQPVLLEQRLFMLSRAIMAQLEG